MSIFLFVLYYLLAQYHFRVKTPLDISLVLDNKNEAFNIESIAVIFATMKNKDFYIALSLIPFFSLLHVKFKIFVQKSEQNSSKLGLFKIATFLTLVFIMPYPFDEISYLVKSSFEQITPLRAKKEHDLSVTISSKLPQSRPNIFIVTLESFNGLYVEKKTKEGLEFTPVYNSLISEGLYIEKFYGQSVQTIKGQFSLLCSRYPLLRGKASYLLNLKKLKCAPSILKELGYYNFFHYTFGNIHFDNSKKFFFDMGFDELNMNKSADILKENFWGWGLQDDYSYRQFIKRFKEIKEQNQGPIFAYTSTTSHHMKFNHLPKRHWAIHKNPTTKKHYFENSIHASDKFLKTFIDQLKENSLYENSIIIITADHSYPNGEHGYYDSQTGYNEEFFRIPLLIIWKGRITPKRLKDKAYSQVDILPTLLDLIGQQGKFPFSGTSILEENEGSALLVQPYNGIYLSSVRWPFKLVFDKKMNRNLLYNLQKDPKERRPISNHKIEKILSNDIDRLLYNHDDLMGNYQ